jgi:hypothetical protein
LRDAARSPAGRLTRRRAALSRCSFDPLGLMDPREAGGFITPSWLSYAEARAQRPASLLLASHPTTARRRAPRERAGAPARARRAAAAHAGRAAAGARALAPRRRQRRR